MKLSPDVINAIDASVLCWLATATLEGQPNVSPKEVWTYFKDELILIANIASPKTLRNLRENPAVCVSFIDIFSQQGYQIKGRASIIGKRQQSFNELAYPLQQIAGERFPFAQLFAIEPLEARAILAPSYVMYPDATTIETQRQNAYRQYRVTPSGQ